MVESFPASRNPFYWGLAVLLDGGAGLLEWYSQDYEPPPADAPPRPRLLLWRVGGVLLLVAGSVWWGYQRRDKHREAGRS